jgi:CO dehydrogenase/acetyl-CoA synthase alpha subunit
VPVGDQPQPLDDTRLAEIKARVEAASKGPWKVCEDYSDVLDGDGHQIISHFHDADGQFTAHARQDVPALLAEVEHLKAELAKHVGQEPTVAEEMAYLRRCLDAVDALHLPEKLKVDSISRDYRNGYVHALADMREALELPAITAAEEAS